MLVFFHKVELLSVSTVVYKCVQFRLDAPNNRLGNRNKQKFVRDKFKYAEKQTFACTEMIFIEQSFIVFVANVQISSTSLCQKTKLDSLL